MPASDPVRPTIIAKIVGGLGNQLFCYAAARRMALLGGADLCLDINFFRSDIYFGREYRLNCFPLPLHQVRQSRLLLPALADTYWWRIKRKLAATGIFPGADYLIERDPHEFDARLLTHKIARNTYLDGYWQDERYFAEVADQLRVDLRLLPDLNDEQRKLAALITTSNAVAIHTRRMQYAASSTGNGGGSLTPSYYHRALEAILDLTQSPVFFCFGDDPEWFEEWWPASIPRTVVHHAGPMGEVIDFWMMTQCRHYIVANSTFGWWSAWLGNAPDKKVLAPKRQNLAFSIPCASGWVELDW
jgi:hypothetical protein